MRYSLLVSAAFAALAVASPVKRDLQTIISAVNNASQNWAVLGAAAESIPVSNGQQAELAVESSYAALNDGLKTGAASVNAMGAINLSPADLKAFVTASNFLINNNAGGIQEFIQYYSTFKSLGRTGQILAALNTQKSSTEALFAAIRTKVPAPNQAYVQTQGQTIVNSINQGIAAFSH